MTTEHVKCLIIGSGPAGYTAAIYTSRANIAPVLYEGLQPGGQLTITTEVENFPGYPEGVTGPVLMDDLRKQAERFGADIRNGIVTKADLSQAPYKFIIDEEKEITADTVIISTGATAKYLGLEDEKKYAGMGVSACATCDGFFYRKKTVAVVGGGGNPRGEGCAGRCSRSGWRRHRLRRSHLPRRTGQQGLSGGTQAFPARFEDHAGTRTESPQHHRSVRTQRSRPVW